MRRRATRTWVVALMAATGGCVDGGGAGSDAFTVVDSAGIEIVTSSAPAWSEATAWRLEEAPELSIGGIDGVAGAAFTQLFDATRLPDGTIVAVEYQTAELRIFDPAGVHVTTFGGYGDGPTELGTPPDVVSSGDTIVVWDGVRNRLLRFDRSGELLDERSYPHILEEHGIRSGRGFEGWRITPDGRLLSATPERPGRGDGLGQRTLRIAAFGTDGQLTHDFGSHPLSESFRVRGERVSLGIGNGLAHRTAVGLGGGAIPIHLAEGPEWEIRAYREDGALGRIVRAAVPRTPVTGALLESAREDLMEPPPGSGITEAQITEAFAQVPVPDSVPAIAQIHFSTDGSLWVARRVRRVWDFDTLDVLGAEGRWLGTVELPASFRRILEIGPDYLLAERVGELDVPYLELYRLVRR